LRKTKPLAASLSQPLVEKVVLTEDSLSYALFAFEKFFIFFLKGLDF
jgi:hypothetical protein